ncbi:MAG: phosphatidate cytidylyltransferase [Bacteroidales bacterium]|nr:phosphatidate cytidylyltransferase [Bacteroidales bacterium]MDD3431020.1 phosphatidate cytidylyltransferase [Bacteroidales bacterium]MDD4361396.1 phosphatidate cytidylyltransferase [Bacteroidales bacterium]MDD4431368.1 phosphatidate cytidylyltransferase [Bacteroidales bacterium]
MKELYARGVSGIVFVALVTFCILFGSYSFALLFALITGLSLWEFYTLIEKQPDIKINKLMASLSGVYLFAAAYFYFSGLLPAGIFLPWLGFLIYFSAMELFKNGLKNLHALAYTCFGQIYISLAMVLLMRMAFLPSIQDNGNYHPVLLMSFFVLVWIADTSAYVIGSLFGKHKLFERISPKKTWEGFIGELIITIAAAVPAAHWFPEIFSLGEWMGFAAVIVVFGLLGDLFESLIKRTVQVKDSGNLIPGHGGLLDRMDTVLLAIPALSLYLLFIQ